MLQDVALMPGPVLFGGSLYVSKVKLKVRPFYREQQPPREVMVPPTVVSKMLVMVLP